MGENPTIVLAHTGDITEKLAQTLDVSLDTLIPLPEREEATGLRRFEGGLNDVRAKFIDLIGLASEPGKRSEVTIPRPSESDPLRVLRDVIQNRRAARRGLVFNIENQIETYHDEGNNGILLMNIDPEKYTQATRDRIEISLAWAFFATQLTLKPREGMGPKDVFALRSMIYAYQRGKRAQIAMAVLDFDALRREIMAAKTTMDLESSASWAKVTAKGIHRPYGGIRGSRKL